MTQFSASDPVVILSYARTPMGGMQGALADVSATDLGATAVKAAVERSGVAPDKFDRESVAEQLRSAGVLEAVKVSRAGYPVRSAAAAPPRASNCARRRSGRAGRGRCEYAEAEAPL